MEVSNTFEQANKTDEVYNKNGNLSMKGKFNNDHFVGSYFYQSGYKYEGEMEMKNTVWFLHGRGKLFQGTSVILFDGIFKNNLFYNGAEYYENGKIQYQGEYKDSQPDGYGTRYDLCGNFSCHGEWKAAKLVEIYIPFE